MILLTPRDLLAPAGEEAVLEVEVELLLFPFVDPAARGVEVEVDGAGKARTGADGVARIPLGRLEAGTRKLRVRARGVEGEAFVRAVAKDAPILVSDIDHTLADVSSVGFIFLPSSAVRPLPGAREALEALSAKYELLYLTARDHVFRTKTRTWLRENRFPEAPIYLRRDTRFWSCRSGRHKTARLGELSAFSRLVAGVGDAKSDLVAYAARGLKPVQIGRRPFTSMPEGAVFCTDWPQITALLFKPFEK